MRRVEDVESLYLDFDGFFASVEQQADPALRGRPVGVVAFPAAAAPPYPGAMIACSREAKAAGLVNIMGAREAKRACPDIVFVAQKPDLYRRAQDALLNEIQMVVPIERRKSIDEMTATLDVTARRDPAGLARRVKSRIAEHIGPYVTCSIGMSANRMLAKIACKLDKPDGLTIIHPRDLPGPLLRLDFDDIPGIGSGNRRRLERAGLPDMTALWNAEPKRVRAVWGNVNGERLWYALHGYDIHAEPSVRSMFGHSRILPPDERAVDHVRAFSRILLTKAARRMRRAGFRAHGLEFSAALSQGRHHHDAAHLPGVSDDHAILGALMALWARAEGTGRIHARDRIFRVAVVLFDLSPASERQLGLFARDDPARQRWERLTGLVDATNRRFGRTAISLGPWPLRAGELAGGKIAFTRIPAPEDFW